MSSFSDWNKALLEEYFSPASCGEAVWLQIDRHELDSFGLHIGGADGLISAVEHGPPWIQLDYANCATVALKLVEQRRAKTTQAGYIDPGVLDNNYANARAPTYLPILALWVLASSELSDRGFYAKVGEMLCQHFPNTPSLTNAMSRVWEDLERWSDRECAGRFGIFRLRVLGEHRFVGIPKSQCLATRRDVRGMCALFSAAGLRPRQTLTPLVFGRLADLAKDSHYISAGLRSAFSNSLYRDPLEEILSRAIEAWDGRRPPTTGASSTSHGKSAPKSLETDQRTTLELAPSGIDSEGWEVRWRFSASGHASDCFLVIDGVQVPSRLEPWSGCFSSRGDTQHQSLLRSLLAKTASSEVHHGIEYVDRDAPELGGGARVGRIDCRAVRILTWDAPDPNFGEVLVERGLPVFGPVYLVCSSSSRESLIRYLRNESIQFIDIPPNGLPDGWALICIEHAERLSLSQRLGLSDEDEAEAVSARLRFVGGRPILRGGLRFYAWYDLPMLEMEALPNVSIAADGVDLVALQKIEPHRDPPLVRRFAIRLLDEPRLSFDFRAVLRGQTVASVRLRISPPEGAGIGPVRSYSFDSIGRGKADDLGLRGVSIGDATCVGTVGFTSGALEIESCAIGIDRGAWPHESGCGKFLDSLAQLGSVSYGIARDQLARLADSEMQPTLLMLDLRSRAFLELQVDEKGHLVRVHAVPPTLYSLPATVGGIPLFGVCGSLRIQQWVELFSRQDCISFLEPSRHGRLPTLRLAILEESAHEVADSIGLKFEQLPCGAISRWAGSIEVAKSELVPWGWCNFSADLNQLQRLHPKTAQFIAVPSGAMVVDTSTKCQLFRFDDPQVHGLQVYMLGTISADTQPRFSFIHDSRWGVWISESAFAAMLRDRLERVDVFPWPIHYSECQRSLWLPARMKPPLVIERALTVCSGSGPQEVASVGFKIGEKIELRRQDSGARVGFLSPVYEAFVPGTWLCYEWVPPEVATLVGALLGGKILPLSDSKG